VVPFAGDQPFWADRLHTLGIAPKAINGTRIDADTLAAAIQFAEDAVVQARAAALGAAMAREDGPAAAIAAIEALVRRN
jgi:UDP:flavonoid glycosyltransferase YjiC (YdhE family)